MLSYYTRGDKLKPAEFSNRAGVAEQEVVASPIAIIHVFSCRVYGLRKYKKGW